MKRHDPSTGAAAVSNSDAHKDPREKIVRLLGDDKHKNPHRRYGPQHGRLVPCWKKGHPHHPENEICPECLSWLEHLEQIEHDNRTDPSRK